MRVHLPNFGCCYAKINFCSTNKQGFVRLVPVGGKIDLVKTKSGEAAGRCSAPLVPFSAMCAASYWPFPHMCRAAVLLLLTERTSTSSLVHLVDSGPFHEAHKVQVYSDEVSGEEEGFFVNHSALRLNLVSLVV